MICVYHIINKETDEVLYVGSTNDFKRRQSEHKKSCKSLYVKERNYPIYKYIRENNIQYDIKPIKILDNDFDLLKEEQKEMDKHTDLLNTKNSFGRNEELYRIHLDTYKKKYYQQNREKIINYQKKQREINRDTKLQYNKKYYEDNKKKIQEKKLENIKCDCGCEIRKHSLYRHVKTKKHQTYLENKS